VDGAAQIKKKFPDAVTVMLIPPDGVTVEARLRGRGTETDEVIARRMMRAREEIALASDYDYVVVSSDGAADVCAGELYSIMRAERLKSCRMKHVTDAFFDAE